MCLVQGFVGRRQEWSKIILVVRVLAALGFLYIVRILGSGDGLTGLFRVDFHDVLGAFSVWFALLRR